MSGHVATRKSTSVSEREPLYSSATRGTKVREEKYRARFDALPALIDEPEEETIPAPASFAPCIKWAFEIDPER